VGASRSVGRRALIAAFVGVVLLLAAVGGLGRVAGWYGGSHHSAATPLTRWLAGRPLYIAHRGGDADWPEGSALAYRNALAWNGTTALEVPVWRTSDGVWVVSEDRDTGRVFGTEDIIKQTTWAQLSTLRSTKGAQPLSRLEQDVLQVVPRDRILFVDDKSDTDVPALLDLLDRYGGAGRIILKGFWSESSVPSVGHARGYTTWGYYYGNQLSEFPATQNRWDLLGINWSASHQDYRMLEATGKPVIAHIVASRRAATTAFAEGARGLMVSGLKEVVPQQPPS
jgi:glycerophosphoryl diester phosphodiesterase